jgi:hypothetical protein
MALLAGLEDDIHAIRILLEDESGEEEEGSEADA